MYRNLFSKIRIGNRTIKNRIVMTAMGNHLAGSDGAVSERDIAFYAARAKGGCGLIITECAAVDWTHGRGNQAQISVDHDGAVEGLRRLADAVHRHGAKLAVQIYHPGRQGIAALNGVASMPSASQTECQCTHQPAHEMTKDEILEMEEKFVRAAVRVKDSGADMVEIHAAHGYLINQFLSTYTNKRTDEYGGSFENRMRFLDEIIGGIRRACGKDFPILVRFSADECLDYAGIQEAGIRLEEGVRIAVHLEEQGVDALNVSAGIYETMNVSWEPVGFDQGWTLNMAAAVKSAVSVPVIGAAVLRDPDFCEAAIAEGKIDMMGSARTFFADPEWAQKAKEGRLKEIRKCIQCMYCMESLGAADTNPDVTMACAVNYEGGKETEVCAETMPRDGRGRIVAVAGAGPAGMEAARILAMRGFRPVIFEKQGVCGGKTYLASKPPKKEKTKYLLNYQLSQLEKYGVEIRLNCEATPKRLKELNPCAVFLAHGTRPVMPFSIPGIDGENVRDTEAVLREDVVLRDCDVAVIGSGMTGIETAEFLAEQGNRVQIFEMADEIGPGVFPQILTDCLTRLREYGAKLHTKTQLLSIEKDTAVFRLTDSKEMLKVRADAFVISLGNRPAAELTEQIAAQFDNVRVLGDAVASGRIEAAVRTGYEAAYFLKV